MRSRTSFSWLLLALPALAGACGGGREASPFVGDAGGAPGLTDASDAADAPDAQAVADAKSEEDPTLGEPCLDDGQCDDQVACTIDHCDTALSRCRHVPDDKSCQNSLFCDGIEVCEPKLGCRPGVAETCDDGDTCTVDACVEASQGCTHAPRDADGDGDPDAHCFPAHDCNDLDPAVSSVHDEVCANGKDDDCDGQIDETPCIAPAHDTCLDPLEIKADGTYPMATAATKLDYAATCSLADPKAHDVVAAIEVPPGPSRDVLVAVEIPGGQGAVALAGLCGDASSEIACGASMWEPSNQTQVARIRARALAPGNYPLYVWTNSEVDVSVHVAFLDPAPKATNETCGTAAPITIGVPTTVQLLDAAPDLATACTAYQGDLVYAFDLAATSDVSVHAASIDGYGTPTISLRDAACALPTDELACENAPSVDVYARALPAGTYYVAVSSTASSDLSVDVEVSPPTTPPADESCAGAPPLAHNQTIDVPLAGHVDDIKLGCVAGYVDAAYDVELTVPSDVLLVERISSGDAGALELSRPACGGSTDRLICGYSGQSPVRASLRNVPAGSYRAVVETLYGNDTSLTAFVRPTAPPNLVPFADVCASAVAIPPEGGFFQGNTTNATADYPAGCDLGTGGSSNGAADQMLTFTLGSTRRVVLDMSGSAYTTILDVRQGSACPGAEVPSACSVGFAQARSYLDLVLPAGTYWAQIDGYDGASGAWFLDVRIVDP